MAMPISLGSGATLSTSLQNGEHLQIISPVSLYPLPAGSNSIGFVSLPSLTGNFSVSGLVSLPSGTEVRSLATILNFPATQAVSFNQLVSLPSGTEVRSLATIVNFPATQAVTQSGTWNVGLTALTSLASGTEVRSLATILNFPATQAVTQSGTWNAGITGLVSLASGTEVRSLATILNFPATQAVSFNQLVSLASGTFVSLNAGSNHIGSVSIFGSITANTGMTTLFPGPNYIGLVSVSGNVNIQSGATVTSSVIDTTATGTITANGQTVSISCTGKSMVGFYWDGGFSGNITFQATVDGSSWFNVPAQLESSNIGQYITWDVGGAVSGYIASSGFHSVRLQASSAGSGTGNVTLRASLIGGIQQYKGLRGGTLVTSAAYGALIGGYDSDQTTFEPLPLNGNEVKIGGIVGHGTNDTGYPVKLGGRVKPQNTIVSTASGTRTNAWFDTEGRLGTFWQSGATVAVSNLPAIPAGSNHIGSVSIFGSVTANTGMTTLFPGPNYIGLVTSYPAAATTYIGLASVSGNVNTTQAGTWTVQPGNTANSTPWLVTQSGGLVSLPSGTEVRSLATILNFPATQAVSFNQLVSLASGTFVSLNAGSNHIGSVSIFGTVTANTGMATLFPGPNYIGLVTTFPAAATTYVGLVSVSGNVNATQAGTWTVQPGNTANTTPWLVTQSAGLLSLASGTEVRSLATILNFPATQAVSFNLVSLASGTFVSLNAGTNHIGSVSVFGSITANTGMSTLFPGPNYIGLVTTFPAAATTYIGLVSVSGNVNATQTGTWTVQPGNTANSTPWLVTQSGGLLSLASGTEIRSLATLLNQPPLVASSAFIGLVTTVLDRTSDILGGASSMGVFLSTASGTLMNMNVRGAGGRNADVLAGADAQAHFSGLAAFAQSNVWNGSTWDRVRTASIANATTGIGVIGAGMMGFDGTNYYRQFVDINGVAKSQATLNASSAFIGLVTIVPTYLSTYTSLQTVQGLSGAATLVVPPSGKRWILKDIFASAYGGVEMMVASASVPIIPYTSLATQGGYTSNFGDSGVRANAIDQALVINTKSTATLSYMVNVRFE